MRETVVFRNELGGYSNPYDKETLLRLYYELQKGNERLTAENAVLKIKCERLQKLKSDDELIIDEFLERLKEEEKISFRRYGIGIRMPMIFRIADELKFELFLKKQENQKDKK